MPVPFRSRARAIPLCLAASLVGCRAASEADPRADLASVRADALRRSGVPALGALEPPPHGTNGAELLAAPLSDASVVKLALVRNASVRERYESLGIARAELLQAGLIANPVFGIDLKAFAGGPEVEVGLAQSFVELFFVPLRRRVAAQELSAVEARVVADLVRLAFDARRALVQVRAAEAVVRIREEALASVTTAIRLMRRLHDAGNVRDSDLSVEEVGESRAQLTLAAARARVAEARESVHVLIGLTSPIPAWTVAAEPFSSPPPAPAPGSESTAIAASLDLLEYKARIGAAIEATGLARREGILPGLEIGPTAKREAPAGPWGFGPGVAVTLPLFDQGQARALAASAHARRLCARHEHLGVEIASAARRLAGRLDAARERERVLREVYVPLRMKYVDDTMRSFNAMQIGAFDVLDAKLGEADARREHAEALLAAWVARFDLDELLAGHLHAERLEPPSDPEPADAPDPPEGH
jgi:cobalt-zinc-cadmium efflux system outer membrane protein